MNRNHEAGHTPVHSEMERCALGHEWQAVIASRTA